jgi:tetratricopeptide (TPR) repeat protein
MKKDQSNEASELQSEMESAMEPEAAFQLFEKRGQSDVALDALKQVKKRSESRKSEKENTQTMRDEDKSLDDMVELQREFSQIHNEALLAFLSRGLHAPSDEMKVEPKAGNSELQDLTKQLVHMQEIAEKEADIGVKLSSDKFNLEANNNEFMLILRYNTALTLLCSGNANAGQHMLEPIYSSMTNQVGLEDKGDDSESSLSQLSPIYCDIAFLLLECIVHASAGTCVLANIKIASPVDSIFQWISAYLKKIEKELYDNESQDLSSTTALHELKFRTHLYKSRILFLKGNTADTQRLSKKEMKSAMEILQHKLRRPESVDGAGAPNASGSHNVALKMDKKYHQIALYLKANSEHLKGNTKKALKLCAEASSAGEDLDGTKPGQALDGLLDASMHYNNLAIIHQSAGKVHIALHYYVRALSLIEKINQTYSSFADIDGQGFASPVPLAEILHNASLCAAQAGKWESAYECMAKCTLVSPEVFARRARCWLHIAEACIGE